MYAPSQPVHWGAKWLMSPIRAAGLTATPGWSKSVPVVMTGDSRPESFTAPSVCGKQALELGFAGITIGDLGGFMSALSSFTPKYVVVQIGANDATMDPTCAQQQNLSTDLAALIWTIRGFMATPSNLIMTTPYGFENGYSRTSTDTLSFSQRARDIAQLMVAVCAANWCHCIDLNALLSNPDTTAKAGVTCDGTHPSASTWTTTFSALSPLIV